MVYFPATPALGLETGQTKPKREELIVEEHAYSIVANGFTFIAEAMIAEAIGVCCWIDQKGIKGQGWGQRRVTLSRATTGCLCLTCHHPGLARRAVSSSNYTIDPGFVSSNLLTPI